MTNEELAAKIHEGDSSLLPQLWQQVEKLVRWKANRVLRALGGSGGVEFGDLYNSGYLALVDAVKSYTPDKGAFSTWLVLHMQTAFAEATNYRTRKQKNDPMRSARSLSEPLRGDTDGVTLGDSIPDDTDQIADVEERVWLEQLHDALEQTLEQLDSERGAVLRQRYFDNCTFSEISRSTGVTMQRCVQLHNDAILKIRRKHAASLRQFIDGQTDFYLHVGVRQFTSNFSSAVELLAIRRDNLERKYLQRAGA